MAALPTSSFRAPAEHHALVHAIAKALRRRPDLAEPLRLLLAQAADTEPPAEPLPDLAGLLRRLDVLERQVAEHAALLALQVHAGEAEKPTGTAGRVSKVHKKGAAAEPLTTGEGRQRRLTSAGLAEIDRRLQAGEPVAVIAEALGVPQQRVAKARVIQRNIPANR